MTLTHAQRRGLEAVPFVPKGGPYTLVQTNRARAQRQAVSASAGSARPTSWYRPVLAADVPDNVRYNAERTLCDVGVTLQLASGSVPLRWFEPCNEGDDFAFKAARQLAGLCPQDGGEIYLDASQGVAAARETCAHELRHVWQARTGFSGDREAHERDAYSFAARWIER